MNKTEFINAVAAKEGIEKKCAEKAVNAVFATIADELAKAGFEVDAKMVEMTDAKTLGEHTASVRLHKEVVATVNFNVVVEEA